VYVDRDNTKTSARVGFILHINDKIITKNSSKAILLFNDNTSITIGKNSILSVNKYVFDIKVPSNNKATFGFGTGIFKTISGKIGKLNREEFKMKTSTATIGIRGSDGITVVKKDGSVQHSTSHGAFILTDNKTGNSVLINQGTTGKLYGGSLVVLPTTVKDTKEISELEEENKSKEEKTKLKEEKKEVRKKRRQQRKRLSNEKSRVDDLASTVISSTIDQSKEVEIPSDIIEIKGYRRFLNNDVIEYDKMNVTINKDTNSIVKAFDNNQISILSNYDNESTWGYWSNDFVNDGTTTNYTSTWVAGMRTDESILDKYIDGNTNTHFDFAGKMIGSVYDFSNKSMDMIKLDSSNFINLSFDFGSGTGGFTSDFSFNTESGSSWNGSLSGGNLNNGGFFRTNNVVGAVDGVEDSIISSQVNGKFYGTDEIKSVGGSFQFDTTDKSAFGSFKADKQ